MTHVIDVDFNITDTVYLTLDQSKPGIVTGYTVGANEVLYKVSWENHTETTHYGFELTSEKGYS